MSAGRAAIPVCGALLAFLAPLFVQQLISGAPLLLAALVMAAFRVEARRASR